MRFPCCIFLVVSLLQIRDVPSPSFVGQPPEPTDRVPTRTTPRPSGMSATMAMNPVARAGHERSCLVIRQFSIAHIAAGVCEPVHIRTRRTTLDSRVAPSCIGLISQKGNRSRAAFERR
jgi:hypothetical protein